MPCPDLLCSQHNTCNRKNQEYAPDHALSAQSKKSSTKDLGVHFLNPSEHSLYKRANHGGDLLGGQLLL